MRRMASLLLLLLTFVPLAISQDSAKTSFISDNIDKTADPCVDFFQYACGSWLAKHPIPADRATYGTGQMVFDQNLDALHEALEVAANPTAGTTRVPSSQNKMPNPTADAKAQPIPLLRTARMGGVPPSSRLGGSIGVSEDSPRATRTTPMTISATPAMRAGVRRSPEKNERMMVRAG